jgi:hypothetical protein
MGVRAKELERQPGVTGKTAWRMAGLVRQHRAAVDGEDMIGGSGTHVAIDESFGGGGEGPPSQSATVAMKGYVQCSARLPSRLLPVPAVGLDRG